MNKINFKVKPGEMILIIEPNGSRKSTLLKCLNRILKPEEAIYIDSKELGKISIDEIAKLIGYIPQRGEINHLTVFDTILLGRRPHIK